MKEKMTTASYRFGTCSLRVAAREFRRDGVRIDLSPRIFDCLTYLIQHRDRAIGRDELLAAVWGKADIGEAVLVKTILAVRRAIGDTAEAQMFVRTIPRFGYHWVGPVEVLRDGEDPPRTDPSRQRRQRVGRAVAMAVLLTIMAVAGVSWIRHRVPPGAETAPASGDMSAVVVLPVDVDGQGDDAWLRLGLMDLLSNRLRDGGLTVAPSDSVVRLLGANGSAALDSEKLLAATGGGITVRSVARRDADGWLLRASWQVQDGTERAVEARAADAITAGRRIADLLLDLQGTAVPRDALADREVPLDELLQRLEAARLTDDLEQARELLAQATPALRGSPEIRMRQAQIDIRAGRFDDAVTTLTAVLAELPAETRLNLRVQALNLLGIATQRVGQLDASVMWFSQAVTMLQSHPKPILLARVLTGRGGSLALLRRQAEAAEDFARARVHFRLAGDLLSIAWIEANEGTLNMDRGRLDSAIPQLEQAASAFRRAGFLNEEISTSANLTQAQLMRMKPVDALAASDTALRPGRSLNDSGVLAHFNLWRLHALTATGRLTEARLLADRLIEMREDPEAALFQSVGHGLLGQIDYAQEQYARAEDQARRAVAGLEGMDRYWSLRADAWLLLIRAQRAADPARAALEADAFLRWAATGPHEGQSLISLVRAEQAAADPRDPSAAYRHYEDAMAKADALGIPSLIAEVAQSYGNVLIARGDLQRAITIVGKTARWASGDYGCAVLQAQLYLALGDHGDALREARAWAVDLAGERLLPAALREPASAEATAHATDVLRRP
ncbi:Putative transcriptional regulatory protein, HTH DNA binding domain [Dokdonella koreensis DS-123]|uniref:Transcriptional regulatory protein, HTH DNA binding domain n=2 Tax=Dokdonella TaxID=323413 RepID=A0A160DY22_9GAMM|nr:Putative transcriptional regulatory protein, HTH DNA binding domain [Dokdonella koreensis DS-123]